MATTSKLSFRARNLDANRGMRVYFADELPDISECAPIARGVNPMPTGMEKEEEMETHLQEAIHAQQASTSGISDNHVIPTPKVMYIDEARYDQVYPVQPPCKAQLMKVQAWLSMEREEAEYDMDSEDEEYLRDKPHISSRDLEKIMADLEAQSSESAICQPATARKVLMPNFDDNVIDDVYDYWLSKRKEAATAKTLGFGGLIPRIRTECRKENEKLNPYVAFRRRAEKMQTRKNRKNDEDSYEKVLRLGHDLRRAVHLFEMVKRREKSKLAMIDLDSEILEARAQLGDYGSVVYNQILAKLQPEEERVPPIAAAPAAAAAAAAAVDPALQPLRGEENGVKRKKMRKRVSVSGLSATFDRDLPNKAWLKKNAEVWNQTPTAFISSMGNFSPAVEQVDQSVAAANTANADGRYAFKRRKFCHYRAPAPLKDKLQNGALPSLDSFPPERRFHYVSMPSTSRDAQPMVVDDEAAAEGAEPAAAAAAAARPKKELLRRRIGRGGRIVFDQFPHPARRSLHAAQQTQRSKYVAGGRSSCGVIYDPFELDCVAMDSEETSKWEARPRRTEQREEEDDDDDILPPVSTRYLHSARYRRTSLSAEEALGEEVALVDWLGTAISPSPSPSPPAEEEEEAEAVTPTEVEEGEEENSSPPKRPTPIRPPQQPPGDEDPPGGNGNGDGGGGKGDRSPSEHEDSTTSPKGDASPRKKSSSADERLSDVLDYVAKPSNGAAARRMAAVAEEDATMDEDSASASSASSEDHSPTSSSEQDREEAAGPLGGMAGAAMHHATHQQLHLLASGNASVLSPPDSTAPSPRVSNGNSSGGVLVAGASPLLAAIPAPHHTNGHHTTTNGPGNGGASGYEAARADDAADASPPSEADAWRMRAKLVTMEAVASRLSRVNKDPDASSRESGCSPTEKSLPHSPSEDGVEEDEAVDGVVVQLVHQQQPLQQQKKPCWRQPSNLPPSESNSSSDWTPPTRTTGDVTARISAYATLSSEEESGARTGDHPSLPAKPTPRKQNGGGAAVQQQQMGGVARSYTLDAPLV